MTYPQETTNDLIQGLIDGSIVLRAFHHTKYDKYEPDRIEAEFSVFPIGTRPKKHALFGIKKVIFHDPATIVFWEDGTKTVVKRGENDIFDPEKGLVMAIAKKALGNKGNYYNAIKKWLPESGGYGCSDPFAGIISKAIDSVGRIAAAFENAAFEND